MQVDFDTYLYRAGASDLEAFIGDAYRAVFAFLVEDLDAAIARGDVPPLDGDYLAQAGSSARLTCPFGPVRSPPTRGLRGWP